MMLRLVLVGMVTALGVSIPSQPSGGNWFDSAEVWATSLLAEWDTWEPTDGIGPDMAARTDHIGCEECRLARLRVASNAMLAAKGTPAAPKGEDTKARPLAAAKLEISNPKSETSRQPKANASATFEPIRVREPFESGIAYELNRMSEGLGNTAATSRDAVATSTASERALPADAFELGIWGELYRIAIEPVEVAKPLEIKRCDEEAVSCLDDEWGQVGCLDDAPAALHERSVLADLPRDVFAPAPLPAATPAVVNPAVMPAFGTLVYVARKASASVAASAPKASKPLCGQIPAVGTLVYLPRRPASVSAVAAPLTMAAPLPMAAVHAPESARPVILVDLPRDVFAPAPAVLAQKPVQSDHHLAGAQSQPPRLGEAVELTRRAVSAWVSVLIGPALVDVSRR